jgi:hypothetical protein
MSLFYISILPWYLKLYNIITDFGPLDSPKWPAHINLSPPWSSSTNNMSMLRTRSYLLDPARWHTWASYTDGFFYPSMGMLQASLSQQLRFFSRTCDRYQYQKLQLSDDELHQRSWRKPCILFHLSEYFSERKLFFLNNYIALHLWCFTYRIVTISFSRMSGFSLTR